MSRPLPIIVTEPATYPVTVEEAKLKMRIDAADSDDRIADLISVTTAMFDGYYGVLGRALMPQTWSISMDRFPEQIRLPLGPLVSVSAVTYVDPAGDTQTVSTSDYEVDLAGFDGWIVPVEPWPETMATINAVRVEWVAGTGCPKPVAEAIKSMIEHFHDRSGQSIPVEVGRLIAPYQRSPISGI